MSRDSRHPSSPFESFLEALWKDLANGSVSPLHRYLEDFPGDERRIAQSYAEIIDPWPRIELAVATGPASARPPSESASPYGGPGTIGPYRTLQELGRGGQGIVYLAEDTRLFRRVAIKFLTRSAASSNEVMTRFRREAALASKFDHPGICTVYDTGEHEGAPYIVMRYVEGETLAQLIRTAREASGGTAFAIEIPSPDDETPGIATRGARPRSDVLRVVGLIEESARALYIAHAGGIIHRDIKPGNIMVGGEGRPTILDFGLARDVAGDLPTMTRTGDFFGTLAYMSPEQLLQNQVRLDERTDVWSLAVTLYECLTLRRPFDAATETGILAAIQGRDPVNPSRLNPEIPRDLSVVIAKGLEKDRDRRYASAADFARDLRNILEDSPIEARPVGIHTRTLRFARRHRVVLVFTLAAALIGIAAGTAIVGWLSEKQAYGERRFVNVAADLLVEHAPPAESAGPRWTPVPVGPDGRIRIPPGEYLFRARRRNHFPFSTPGPVVVRDGEDEDFPISLQPVSLWTRPVGSILAPPVLLRFPSGGVEVLVRLRTGFRRFAGVSGDEVTPLMGRDSDDAARLWVAGQGDRPLVISTSVRATAYTMTRGLVGGMQELWNMEEKSPVSIKAAEAIGDVDGDGIGDLATIWNGAPGIRITSGADGGRLWSVDPGPQEWNALGHARDRQGRCAVVFVADRTGRFLVLDPGTRSFQQHVSIAGANTILPLDPGSWPCPVAVSGDDGAALLAPGAGWTSIPLLSGRPASIAAAELSTSEAGRELVIANADGISAWTGSGRRLWSTPAAIPGSIQMGAGNLDGVEEDEIVAGGSDGVVRAFSGDGRAELWTFETNAAVMHPPLVEDLDGDGICEVVVAAANERLFVLRGAPSDRVWTAEASWALGAAPHLVPGPAGDAVIVIAGSGSGRFPYETGMSGPAIHGFHAARGSEVWKHMSNLALLWSPDVGDLDGDGALETLAHERSGRLQSFVAGSGVPVFDSGPIGEFKDASPRIADLDGDAKPEIVYRDVRDGRHTLRALDPRTGTELWRNSDDWVESLRHVEVGDIGSDRSIEVVCSAFRQGILVCDGRTGLVRIHFPVTGGDVVKANGMAAIGDVNGDGSADLVIPTIGDEGLSAYDGRSLQRTWSALCIGESRPALEDVDGDGQVDVLFSDYAGAVGAYRGRDGHRLWSTRVSERSLFSSVRVADLDHDGRLEAVVGTRDRTICVLDARAGALLRRIPVESEVFGTALLANVAGDADLEIVIGSDDGKLNCVSWSRRPGR